MELLVLIVIVVEGVVISAVAAVLNVWRSVKIFNGADWTYADRRHGRIPAAASASDRCTTHSQVADGTGAAIRAAPASFLRKRVTILPGPLAAARAVVVALRAVAS